jgi:protein SCO1/2
VKALIVLVALFGLAGTAAADDPRLAIGLDEHVGATLPKDLAFIDSTGTHVRLGQLFDGKRPVLLVMAYARCQMLCSVVLHGVSDALRTATSSPGRDYLPVVVSLDPDETPAEGGRRQNKLLADVHLADRARFPYLTGSDANIHALASALGFRYAWDPKTEQFAHPVVIFVLTPQGTIAEYLRGVTFPGLDAALARAASGATTKSLAEQVIACFHFDPALRRYGSSISLFLKLGSALVLVSLTALVTALVFWERRRRT